MRKAKKFISLLVVALMVLTLVPASIGFAASGDVISPVVAGASLDVTSGTVQQFIVETSFTGDGDATLNEDIATAITVTPPTAGWDVPEVVSVYDVTASKFMAVSSPTKVDPVRVGADNLWTSASRTVTATLNESNTYVITFTAKAVKVLTVAVNNAAATIAFAASNTVTTAKTFAVVPGALASMAITAGTISSSPSTASNFTFTMSDANGNIVTAAEADSWALSIATNTGATAVPIAWAGNTRQFAFQTAATIAQNWFRVTATKGTSTVTVAAAQTTAAGAAAKVKLVGGSVKVGEKTTIKAVVTDANGNIVANGATALTILATADAGNGSDLKLASDGTAVGNLTFVIPAAATESPAVEVTSTVAKTFKFALTDSAVAPAPAWPGAITADNAGTAVFGGLAADKIAFTGLNPDAATSLAKGVGQVFTVKLVDANGNVVNGAKDSYAYVTVTGNGRLATASVANSSAAYVSLSEKNTTENITVSPAVAGNGEATVTVNYGTFAAISAKVVFENDIAGITVGTPSNIVADGAGKMALAVKVVDTNGFAVASNASFAANANGAAPIVTLDAGAQATVDSITNFANASSTVTLKTTATAGAVTGTVAWGPYSKTFSFSTVADTANKLALTADKASAPADNTAVIKVKAQVVDAAGVAVPKQGRSIKFIPADATGLTANVAIASGAYTLTTGNDGSATLEVKSNVAAGKTYSFTVIDGGTGILLSGAAITVPFTAYSSKPILEVTVDTAKVASDNIWTFNIQALDTTMSRPTAAVTGITVYTSIGTLSKATVDTDVSGAASITLTSTSSVSPIVSFSKAGYSIVIYNTSRAVLTAAANDVGTYNASAPFAWKVSAAEPVYGVSTVTVQSVDVRGNSVAAAATTLTPRLDGAATASVPAVTDGTGKTTFTVTAGAGAAYVAVTVQDVTGTLANVLPATITFAEPATIDDPVIEITSPDLEATVHAAAVTLEGTATADTTLKIKTITLQDPAGNLSSKAYPAMGVVNFKFNITLPNATLDNPDNAYTIFAEDTAGNVGSTDITISYEPEFAVDENGDPVLDADGNPVYVGQEPEEQPEEEVPTQPEGPMPTKKVVFTIDSLDFSDGNQPGLLEVAPFLSGANTMIPFRVLATALGVEVSYDAATQKITFDGDKMIELTVGSDVVIIDGSEDTMPAAVSVKAGRSFVPLRFVANQLLGNPGAIVYEPATKMITITVPVPVVE